MLGSTGFYWRFETQKETFGEEKYDPDLSVGVAPLR
jgi:hypothetical protein